MYVTRVESDSDWPPTWTIHVQRLDGFQRPAQYPTVADLPPDIRAGLLTWLDQAEEQA